MNPGIAVWPGAEISVAPEGRVMSWRGPTASITPSRIRMPASGISVVGVKARAACSRMVDIGRSTSYRKFLGLQNETGGSKVPPVANDDFGYGCLLLDGAMSMLATVRVSPSTEPFTAT